MIEFYVPEDPYTIYSINGMGLVWLDGLNRYVIRPINPNQQYIHWLQKNGIAAELIGSAFYQPDGSIIRSESTAIAGAYDRNSLEVKLNGTAFAQESIGSVVEVPHILWSALDSSGQFGMYVAKNPLTVPIPTIFELSEVYGIDVDIGTSFQNGEAMNVSHEYLTHNQAHHGNIRSTIAPGRLPQSWKDFETISRMRDFPESEVINTHWGHIPMTAYEAARLYDVLYFTLRLNPLFTERRALLPLWKKRISAFLFGYFGPNRIHEWKLSMGSRRSDSDTIMDSLDALTYEHMDRVIQSFDSELHENPVSVLRSSDGIKRTTKVMQKTIMQLWLSLERGE